MEVYTFKEVMAILKMSQSTLSNLLKNKRIKAVKTSEGKNANWIIPAESIKEFLKGA